MRHGLVARLLIFCVATLLAVPLTRGEELYKRLNPTGYVNDYAGVIKPEAKTAITNLLAELQSKTTAQVAVVTVRSLEGDYIQDFANRLFERWGIGQKGKDNGVLFVTSVDDRKVWIEIGYGLEPVITDADTGRILDEYVMPYFRKGDYSAGIASGSARIASLIAAHAGVQLSGGAAVPAAERPASGGQGISWFGIIVIIILAIVFIRHPFLFLLILQGMGGGSGRSGGGFGGFGGGGGGFGGFGGGSSGGGGAGRSW
jgi:uncharacterized protein